MTSLFYQQTHPQVLLTHVEDAFGLPQADGVPMLPLRSVAAGQTQGHVVPYEAYGQSDYQEQSVMEHPYNPQVVYQTHDADNTGAADPSSKLFTEAGPTVSIPSEMQNNNQEQIAALVNSREREVNELQTTLAIPLAHFNAKFIWHCIMNIERDCEPAFLEKIKAIHRTFYLPPAISFYTLWLHFHFWDQKPQVYYMVEALLPPPTASTQHLPKPARVAIILYMLSASFANKHLDDFSYRNSSWYEAARMPAKDFLQIELLALKELQWSLEISSAEWSKWLLHLRSSNITLERTRPTTQNFHFVVARLIQDAIIATGSKDEMLKGGLPVETGGQVMRGRNVSELNRPMQWQDSSPTLVASSSGTSPQATEGLHARVNGNIADGPYGLYALQRKLENVQRDAGVQLPKYIPWDTSLDPVVHVQSRSRSSSGSGPKLVGDMKVFGAPYGTANLSYDPMLMMGSRYDGENLAAHNRLASYSQWARQAEMYYGGGFSDMGKMATGPTNGKFVPIGGGPVMPMACSDMLAARGNAPVLLDYNGTKGMMTRPLKTCNIVDMDYGMVDMAYPGWQPRL